MPDNSMYSEKLVTAKEAKDLVMTAVKAQSDVNRTMMKYVKRRHLYIIMALFLFQISTIVSMWIYHNASVRRDRHIAGSLTERYSIGLDGAFANDRVILDGAFTNDSIIVERIQDLNDINNSQNDILQRYCHLFDKYIVRMRSLEEWRDTNAFIMFGPLDEYTNPLDEPWEPYWQEDGVWPLPDTITPLPDSMFFTGHQLARAKDKK